MSWRRRIKRGVRSRVPAGLWSAGSAVIRSITRSSAAAFGGLGALLVRLLPDRFVIALRSRLTLTRRLDYDGAPLRLRVTSPVEHDLRLRSCEKEPETVRWLEQALGPESVLYDVGANVGAYSLVAASCTGGKATVYAFEPGPETFASLVQNIGANGFGRCIVPFPLALGGQTGLASFALASSEAGEAGHPGFGEPVAASNGVPTHQALACRLDELVRLFHLRAPTLLKIDVDGGELGVLEGAGELLRSPGLRSILVEVTEPATAGPPIRTLLERNGFRLEADHGHSPTVRNWVFTRGDG